MIIDPLEPIPCIPERTATLVLQQAQLLTGRRVAQMFPLGTPELPLPEGLVRLVTTEGVFHYWPKYEYLVLNAIEANQLNMILMLGPYNKEHVLRRIKRDEAPLCIVERIQGVELRCTITSRATIEAQMTYFDATKEPNSEVAVELPGYVLMERTMAITSTNDPHTMTATKTIAPASPSASLSASPVGNTSLPPGQSEYSISELAADSPASAEPASAEQPNSSTEP